MTAAGPRPIRLELPHHPTPRSPVARPARRALLLALILAPPVLAALVAFPRAVNVPFWDEWQFAEDVIAHARGELAPAALWRPHNEHRLMLPRLVSLGLARISDWDARLPIGVSWILLLGALAFLTGAARRTLADIAPASVAWLALGASTLLFSLGPSEVWTWGWSIQIVLLVTAVAAGAWMLSRWRGRWSDLALAALGGSAAALSFGSGLLFLPVMALALALAGGGARRGRAWAQAAILIALGLSLSALYLRGFVFNPTNSLPRELLHQPLAAPKFVLAFLGGPLAAGIVGVAIAWGSAGAAAFAVLAGRLLLAGEGWRGRALPWLFLGGFSASMAVLTAGGRLRYGTGQALNAQYQLAATLFWIALLALLALTIARSAARGTGSVLEQAAPAPRRMGAAPLVACAVVATLALQCWLAGWELGRRSVVERSRTLDHASWHLRSGPPWSAEVLSTLFGETDLVTRRSHALVALGLGPFAKGRYDPPVQPRPATRALELPPRAAAPLVRATLELLRPVEGQPGDFTLRLPLVVVERTGGHRTGSFNLQLLVYDDGHTQYDISSPGTRRSHTTSVAPEHAEALRASLIAAGAMVLPHQLLELEDPPTTVMTVLDPRSGGRAHTFSYRLPKGRYGPVEELLGQFLAEHVLPERP